MKILHFDVDDLASSTGGGQARRTFEINARLAANHRITVVTAAHKGAPRERSGVRYRQIGLGTFPVNFLSYAALAPLVATLARSKKYDLVVEDFTSPLGPLCIPAVSGKPSVAIAQYAFTANMAAKYHLPFDAYERKALGSYRNLIAMTRAEAERYKKMAPHLEIDVIENGVEEYPLSLEDPDDGYLAFLGRLEITQKGLAHLAKLVRALPYDVPVRIAGMGPDEKWLRNELSSERKVQFVGQLRGNERFHFLRRARAVVMTSTYETSGLVALEAMATGRPVIGFGITNIAELLEAGGQVAIAPFDVEAMTSAVLSIFASSAEAQRLGLRGRQFAQTKTWDALAAAQEAVYARLVEAHRSAPVAWPGPLADDGRTRASYPQ